jgi:diadenosine tetraphosphatase ApaH/serine/threonine PP2A family protein phosphatase
VRVCHLFQTRKTRRRKVCQKIRRVYRWWQSLPVLSLTAVVRFAGKKIPALFSPRSGGIKRTLPDFGICVRGPFHQAMDIHCQRRVCKARFSPPCGAFFRKIWPDADSTVGPTARSSGHGNGRLVHRAHHPGTSSAQEDWSKLPGPWPQRTLTSPRAHAKWPT